MTKPLAHNFLGMRWLDNAWDHLPSACFLISSSQWQRTGSHSTSACCNAYGLCVVSVPQIPIWACCTLFGTSLSLSCTRTNFCDACIAALFYNYSMQLCMLRRLSWAARYNTWLLIKLTPKGVVFSFFFSFLFSSASLCSTAEVEGLLLACHEANFLHGYSLLPT